MICVFFLHYLPVEREPAELNSANYTIDSDIEDINTSSAELQSVVHRPIPDLEIQGVIPSNLLIPVAEEIPITDTPEDLTVPPEILAMLGESKKTEESFAKKIPQEISERWGKIILTGLAKESKDGLLNKTLIPENFQLAKAPKLNAEVASILTDSTRNRDKRLEKSQNQLGLVVARVVNLTTQLIDGDMDKLEIIKQLSELNQILLDLHYEETMNRRRLIIPLLDKGFWNIIKDVKRDTYLFSESLGENIKISKTIEKSSQQIKKPTPSIPNKKVIQSGNSRAPPRTQQGAVRPPPAPPLPPVRYPRGPALAPPPPAYAARRQPPPQSLARGRPATQTSGQRYDRRARY
jgi:hypothetical protein